MMSELLQLSAAGLAIIGELDIVWDDTVAASLPTGLGPAQG